MSWINTLASWNYQNDFLVIKNNLLETTRSNDAPKKKFSQVLQHQELEKLDIYDVLHKKILQHICAHADLHFTKSAKIAKKVYTLLGKIFNSSYVEKIKFPESSTLFQVPKSIVQDASVYPLLKKYPPILIDPVRERSNQSILRQFIESFEYSCIELDISRIDNDFIQLYFKSLKNQNNPNIHLEEWLNYYTAAQNWKDILLIRAYEALIFNLSTDHYDISFVRDMVNAQVDPGLISRFCSICIQHPRSCIDPHINEALMTKVIHQGWKKTLPEIIKFNFIYSWLSTHKYSDEQFKNLLKLIDFSRVYINDIEEKIIQGSSFLDLLSQEQKEQLCDLCIHIKDKSFNLQSKLLYAHSGYFEALTHRWKENHGNYIELDASDLEVFEIFYHFLTGGVLPKSDFNKIYSTYIYAHRIQAIQLKTACTKALFPLLETSDISTFFNKGYAFLIENVDTLEQNDVIDYLLARYFTQKDLVHIEKRNPNELVLELQDLSQVGFELFLFLHPQIQGYLHNKDNPHVIFKTTLHAESIKFYLICQRLTNHPKEIQQARSYFKHIDMSHFPNDYLLMLSDSQNPALTTLNKKLIPMAYKFFYIHKVDALKKLFLRKIKQVGLGVQLYSKPIPKWADILLKELEFLDWGSINTQQDSDWLYLAIEASIKKISTSTSGEEKDFLKDKAILFLNSTEKYASFLYLKYRAFFDSVDSNNTENLNKRNSLYFGKAPFECYEVLQQMLRKENSFLPSNQWIIHIENYLQDVNVIEGSSYFHHINLIWVMRYTLKKLENMKGLRKKSKLLHEEISSYALPFDKTPNHFL